MPKDFEENGVLDHIAKLSSAEDIFTYLLLPFEDEVVKVSRLHIMKRFGAYLKGADMAGLTENEIFTEARACLKKAYTDFCESTPLKEKVFKVFRDQDAKFNAKFVGIDALTLTAK